MPANRLVIVSNRLPISATVSETEVSFTHASGGLATPIEVRIERVRAEVARLEGLGATRQGEFTEYGGFFIVMQDPESNEFCVH